MKKVLTIIIPHYNSPKLLDKLLDSIPEREELEVIVVDDNSESGKQITAECKEKNNRKAAFFINNTGKKGAGVCRNIGLQHASGEWLLFADADDFFTENLWEKLEGYLQREADIIYFTPSSIYLETGEKAGRDRLTRNLVQNYLQSPDGETEARLRYGFESPWSKLIRNSMVKENQICFDETKVANDVMFSIKCAYAANTIAASEQNIYCVTKSKGTLTTVGGDEYFRIRLGVWVEKYKFLKKRLSNKEWKILKMRGNFWLQRAKRMGYHPGQILGMRIYLLQNGVWL